MNLCVAIKDREKRNIKERMRERERERERERGEKEEREKKRRKGKKKGNAYAPYVHTPYFQQASLGGAECALFKE